MADSIPQNDSKFRTVFNFLRGSQETLQLSKLKQFLSHQGLTSETIEKGLSQVFKDRLNEESLDWKEFLLLKEVECSLIEKALEGRLVIPQWKPFTEEITSIFNSVKQNNSGETFKKVRTLAEVDSDLFSLSICTIDGQVFSIGDIQATFPSHSICKPLLHLCALEEMGEEKFKRYIGNEPSGEPTGSFILNSNNAPHNPLTDAGITLLCGILYPEEEASEKYYKIKKFIEKGVSQKNLDFDNRHYLASIQQSARLSALSYYMKSLSSASFNVKSTLEFYYQCSSIVWNTEKLATMGATLASGGIEPFTQNQVYSSGNVQNCLSVLFSCGIYDYSGEWGYSFGVPAKTSPSGCIWVIIPNVMGMCIYSPKVEDSYKISVRGLEFMNKFIDTFSFHCFDALAGVKEKFNPVYQTPSDIDIDNTVELCYFASQGNLEQVKKLIGSGVSPDSSDYDGRTPLHLAASEGHLQIVQYLLNKNANPSPVDRWKLTPIDDARNANHSSVVELLSSYVK